MNLDNSSRNQLVPSSQGVGRGPPQCVSCLLPIWGYEYVRKFLDLSLPTWLAEGNLPALADTLPTQFVLLTSREDEAFIRHNLLFKRLQKVCPVVVHYIDHLITNANYSTTITLAYTEAVRLAGPAMVDTCFFFLVSDFIVADHSFSNALRRVINGCSGVLVGNFQVAEEDAMPWLLKKLNSAPGALSISSRELMRWGLSNLHPATMANMVNYPLNHNEHTNRLFWRLDNLTLIGRFYLMHMICIRPERTDFFIGAPCDYSFIPEMCPSDNVEIIEDTDEYLAIEMQPRTHEAAFLRARAQTIPRLARSLSMWTTARHRKNAETSVVFHADDIPKSLATANDEASRFVSVVRRRMDRPSPFRDHPFWRGAMAAFKEATGLRMTRREFRYALGLENPLFSTSRLRTWLSEMADFLVLGKGPGLRSWTPRWPDHRLVLQRISPALASNDKRFLFVGDSATVITASIPDSGEKRFRIQSKIFIRHSPDFYRSFHDSFDSCLLEIDEIDMDESDRVLDRVIPLMKSGGNIIVSVYNRRGFSNAKWFTRSISFEATRLLRPAVNNPQYYFVRAGIIRWLNFRFIARLLEFTQRRRLVGAPFIALAALPVALCSFVTNQFSRVAHEKPPRGIVSSFLMVMSVERVDLDAYEYSSDRVRRDRKHKQLRDGDVEAKRSRLLPGAKLGADIRPIVGEVKSETPK